MPLIAGATGTTRATGRARSLRALAVALIWLGLAVTSATQRSIALADRVPQVPYSRLLLDSVLDWGSCAVFTPIAFWLVARYPIARGVWLRHLPRQLVGIAVFVVGKYALHLALLRALSDPPNATLAEVLRNQFAGEAIAFAALLGLVHAVVLHRRWRDEEVRGLALRAELADARLDALVHKLEPHFLFNTLQAISTLLHRDPRAADAMLTRLSELLRELLRADAPQQVPLAEELATARRYLDIMAIRFADRLGVEIDAPAELGRALVPRFVLQPLLENALRHGVGERTEAGRVTVTARRSADRLIVAVEDPGGGADFAPGNGIGLANTRERLRTLHGDGARLEASEVAGGGYRVALHLPLRYEP